MRSADRVTGTAVRRVTQGVGREVLHRLFEAVRIPGDRFGAGRDVENEPNVAVRHLSLVPLGDALEKRRHVDDGPAHGRASAFESSEIEQVADDPLQPVRFLRDDAEIPLSRGGVDTHVGHREGFEVAAHRRERCIQLVRHVRQKLAPGSIR